MKPYALPVLALISTTFMNACAPKTTCPDCTIYPAAQIVTMDLNQPLAEAVLVKDGNVTAMGDLAELQTQFRDAVVDDRFSNSVLIPGLIDPHVHMTLGAMMYGLDFIPPWDMPSPAGVVAGIESRDALLAKIAEFAQNGDDPLILWGYHNLVQGDIDRRDLDAISATRPIIIWHYSGHDFYMNTPALDLMGVTPDLADSFHGIGLDENGALTGRVWEDALLAIMPKMAPYLLAPEHIEAGFTGFETLLRQNGVTLVAEMGYGIFGRAMEDAFIQRHYGPDDSYELVLVPEHRAFEGEFGEATLSKIKEFTQNTTGPRVLPRIKLFTDAAFYSQTMKLAAPGYLSGQSKGTDGLWVTQPDDLPALMARYWDAGLSIHIHSNGDGAQDATLAAFAEQKPAQTKQRLTIEHAGLLTPPQIKRAGELNIGVSAASHYVNYMGADYAPVIKHKTDFITPLRSANAAGMNVTLHSDAPLAPPHPLKAASVHMTRATRQGGVSNPDERLDPVQALHAVTLGAAYALGLEDEVGTISTGKRANFTVLSLNPLDLPAESWPAIPVNGVVLDGVFHAAEP